MGRPGGEESISEAGEAGKTRSKRNIVKAGVPKVGTPKVGAPKVQKVGTPKVLTPRVITPKVTTPKTGRTGTPGESRAGTSASGSGSPISVNSSPMLSPNRYSPLANLVEEIEEINEEKNKEVWKCQKCCKDFSDDDDDKLLECQRCKDHYCIKCLGKSEAEYQLLSNSDLMWFCINCRGKVERNIVIDRDIEEKCNDIMKAFENRMTTLETVVSDKCSKSEAMGIAKEEINNAVAETCSKPEAREIIKEEVLLAVATKCSKEEARQLIREELDHRIPKKKAVEGAEGTNENAVDKDPSETQGTNVNTVLTEINERKLRENNIIFYGILECESTSRDERLKYDQEKVQEVIEKCNVQLEPQEIQKTVRLGKFDKKKKRPVLVTMKNAEKKAGIFKGSKNLKENELFKDIGISNDLTRTERETEKKMYEEAKESLNR